MYTSSYKRKNIIVLLIIIGSMLSSSAMAENLSSARAVAMGGAYLGLANGVDAAKQNPANLGFSSHRKSGMELFGIGASITNNSFSLEDYNKYTGAFLTSEDKQYILEKIPTEGLTLSADIKASALSMSFGSMVISTEVVGLADINLNKDIIDLIFNGNAYADTIEITGSYSEAVAYGAVGLSYGTPLYNYGSRQIAVGATLKVLRGIAIEEIVELNGIASTQPNGFAGEGSIIAHTSQGGSGYALDLGAALKLNENYTAGFCIKNFLSDLSWTSKNEEHGYIFSFDSMTIDNSDQDFIVSDEYSQPTAAFKTNLPSTMTIGFAKSSGKLLWAVDWQQGFRQAAGSSSEPKISVGVELNLIGVLPLRAGFTSGGRQNTAFSFGSGLDLKAFYIDAAMISGASLSPSSSKGINLAVSSGFQF